MKMMRLPRADDTNAITHNSICALRSQISRKFNSTRSIRTEPHSTQNTKKKLSLRLPVIQFHAAATDIAPHRQGAWTLEETRTATRSAAGGENFVERAGRKVDVAQHFGGGRRRRRRFV